MAILAMIAIGLVWGTQGTAHTRQARGRRGTRGEGLPVHRMLGYIRRMVHRAGQWLVKITGPQATLARQRDNRPRPTGGRRPAQHHHNFHRKTHRPNNPGETHDNDNDSMPGLEPILSLSHTSCSRTTHSSITPTRFNAPGLRQQSTISRHANLSRDYRDA
ncbi:hypothetical protein B0H17DRAFT_1151087 [Mycena rosella]|uniref:Secreted protein n=1 Tax=Mycena rosella TaxID=1033263 RepID=A0AAD7FKK7_MYCRO|nr:hypothetical protein B0H17DRAFT_1151087 [Mycena rosella]